jgi:hypothetical protein
MECGKRLDVTSTLWRYVACAVAFLCGSCVGAIDEGTRRHGSPSDPLDKPDASFPKAGLSESGSLLPASDSNTSSAHSAAMNGNAAAMSGWPSFADARSFQLRRLTTQQYLASVQSLLGVEPRGMPAIEHVSPVGGFEEIGASTASVSGMGVSQFEDAARFLAQAAFASTGPGRKLVTCKPTGVDDSACFTTFVRAFGLRAFRRPLTAEETTRYAGLVQSVASATSDVWQGIEAAASAFLQSPNFLYLAELAEPDPENAKRQRFNAYEMASRLAYFLGGDAPDDALLQAAASGKLLTSDDLAEQAMRMLEGEPAHTAVRRFWNNLLALENLDNLSRPTQVFPQFTPSLGQALKSETERVIDDLVFTRDADYRSLFDQTETFVNKELAALYGVKAPLGDAFSRVSLPASSHRAGLLGHAGVLAARDHSDGTSPTRRGLFLLTRLLCQSLPLMPPANLQIPQPPSGLITARQRLEEHTENPVCAACHAITDPVGLSLEHFDALGVYREDDRGLQIDDTGQIDGNDYHGEIELGALLHAHPALGPCLIQSLYGVAVGHLATELDRDTFADLVQHFDQSGARVRALLLRIVSSDGFRYLPMPERP